MSTITKEFTKEQLIERLLALQERYEWALAAVPEKKDTAVDLQITKIALASLEAEPVAWRYRHHNGLAPSNWKVVDSEDECNVAPNYQRQALYTAPPAPVPVPDSLADDIDSGDHPLLWSYNNGWNACRAAMLQGAEPVRQTNKLLDGYCVMPLKLTAENGAKGALCGEFHVQYRIVCQSCVGEGCEDCNHTGGWNAEIPVSWDTIKRIHESAVEACALPAAPQQEVKL